MWRSFVFSLVVAACTETPTGSGIEATSHVATYQSPGGYAPLLDLLIVVDDTAAMAPYADEVAMLPDQIATTLRPEYDLRVAVTTNGGVLRKPAALPEPFVSTRLGFDLTRTSSFDGTLADALRPLMTVGAANSGASQPLAAIRTALDGNPDGFLRDHASLGIVIITASDDASPSEVSEYAGWLQSLASDSEPRRFAVSVLHAGASPRLDSFLTMLPTINHTIAVSLDDTDVSAAVTVFESTITSIIPGTCWIASDLDPQTPGAQYDCTISAEVDGGELLLRPCRDDADDDPLCWRLLPSPQGECGPEAIDPLKPQIAAYHFFSFSPVLHAQCVVLDE
jgi:hypothetical protein